MPEDILHKVTCVCKHLGYDFTLPSKSRSASELVVSLIIDDFKDWCRGDLPDYYFEKYKKEARALRFNHGSQRTDGE